MRRRRARGAAWPAPGHRERGHVTAAGHVTARAAALYGTARHFPVLCPQLAMASGSGVGAAAGAALGAGVALGVRAAGRSAAPAAPAGIGRVPPRRARGRARPRDEGCGGHGGAAVGGCVWDERGFIAALYTLRVGGGRLGVPLRRPVAFRAGSGVAPPRSRPTSAVVESPSVEVFKTRQNVALNALVWFTRWCSLIGWTG